MKAHLQLNNDSEKYVSNSPKTAQVFFVVKDIAPESPDDEETQVWWVDSVDGCCDRSWSESTERAMGISQAQ